MSHGPAKVMTLPAVPFEPSGGYAHIRTHSTYAQSDDPFHRAALRRCVGSSELQILNLTRAEALIHPTRAGVSEQAAAALDALGLTTHPVSDDIADRARLLRAAHGNRNFPLIDAIVVAFGLLNEATIITTDAKWPIIPAAEIEVLSPTEWDL